MVRALVLRGAAVGAFGGLLAYLFAWVFAEPAIQASIDYEAGRSEAEAALAAAAGEMPAPTTRNCSAGPSRATSASASG